MTEEEIQERYVQGPAAYSSVQRIHESFPKGERPSYEQVRKALQKLPEFGRSRMRYKSKTKQRRVISFGPYFLHQIDLAFLPKYKHFIGCLIWLPQTYLRIFQPNLIIIAAWMYSAR